MLRINDFKNICEYFTGQLDLAGFKICSTEDQASKKLQTLAGIWLVAVIPSNEFRGGQDNYKSLNETIFFIVVKEANGQSESSELQQYADTQDKIIALKETLFGDNTGYCPQFPNIDINSVQIDPEYNIFAGWLGWSIKFNF